MSDDWGLSSVESRQIDGEEGESDGPTPRSMMGGSSEDTPDDDDGSDDNSDNMTFSLSKGPTS